MISKYVNAGTMENKGFEVTLTATPIKTGCFTWDVSVNWTRIRNEVTELYGDVNNLTIVTLRQADPECSLRRKLMVRFIGTDYVYTNGERTD